MVAGAAVVAACTDPNAPDPAVQLGFIVQPSNATAGDAISPEITVAIQDASGVTVISATNVVTVTIATGPPGATPDTVRVSAVNGVATFAGLRLDKAGTGYTLKALAPQLGGAVSTAFSVAAAPASQLVFVVPPGSTMGGAVVTPPVRVAAQDAFGNPVSGFNGAVTVTLAGSPAPGTLSGTTTVNAVGGVATFSDLAIVQANPGYTLTASAAGLMSATSAPFAVAKPAGSLRVTTTSTGSPDRDGYAVCVDAGSDILGGTTCAYGGPRAIGWISVVTVVVDSGPHTVLLTGVAAHCAVTGDNPLSVHAALGVTTAVPFTIACADPTLHITTATTGASLDPDGYSVCVDPVSGYDWDGDSYWTCPTSPQPLAVNGAVTLHVAPGSHTVQLAGWADNCEVGGANPRSVDAIAAPVEVPFQITCLATGSVRITTATSGTDLDPDGYSICVDRAGNCYWSVSAHANDVVTVAGVTAGPHTVTLSGAAGNCTVSGAGAGAVTVPANGTAAITFNVACVPTDRIAYVYSGRITVSQLGDFTQILVPGAAPAWSPDGTRLAYECGQDLCAVNADGSGFTQLTFDAADNQHPAWSPDGTRIAFATTRAGTPELDVMAANGSGLARITGGAGLLGSPAWSPDGTRIAFDCRVDAGNDDVCVVNADGSGFARLTTDPARDYGAAWKPDGATLAFATTRYGSDEIAFLNVAAGSVARAGLAGFWPTWSPDGTRLAFVQTYEDCSGGDWVSRLTSGPPRAAPRIQSNSCSSYAVVAYAQSDGSGIHAVGVGTQPAWRPHR